MEDDMVQGDKDKNKSQRGAARLSEESSNRPNPPRGEFEPIPAILRSHPWSECDDLAVLPVQSLPVSLLPTLPYPTMSLPYTIPYP